MKTIDEIIRSHFPVLTKKQKRIAEFITANLEETAFLSLSRLAQKIKVSEASISRFCFKLGFDSYKDLQNNLRELIKLKISPLIKAKKSFSNGKKNNFENVIKADIDNLENLMQNISWGKIDDAVKLILDANKVYVIGLRSSFAPAYLLYHYLNHIGIRSELLDPHAGRLIDQIIYVDKNDVIIGISFPRYFKETIEVLKYVRTQKCRTIIITDNILSASAINGEVILTAKWHTPIPFVSYVSILSLIHCLIFGIITRRKRGAITTIEKIENMMKIWNCRIME